MKVMRTVADGIAKVSLLGFGYGVDRVLVVDGCAWLDDQADCGLGVMMRLGRWKEAGLEDGGT